MFEKWSGKEIIDFKYGSQNYKEICDAFYTKFPGLEQMHNNILDILKKFMEFSVSLGIKPVIFAGSAIGIEMYEGFIPWDDDYDCTMTLEEIDKLMENENLLREKFGLKITSPFRREGRWPILKISHVKYRGAFVDVLPLTEDASGWGHWWRSRLWMLSVIRFETPLPRSWFQKIISYLTNPFSLILPRKKLFKSLAKYCEKKSKGRYGSSIVGSWYIPEKDWLSYSHQHDVELKKFNGVDVYVSKNITEHLSRKYGNYKVFPQLEKIKMKHKSEWK